MSRTLLGALLAFPDLAGRLEPAHLAALPQGYGRELLESLVTSAHEYGARALERLVSPESERLNVEQKDAFLALVARAEPLERPVAERALRDCQLRLASEGWQRESRALQERLREARDPSEEDSLLLAKQRLLEERRAVR